MGKKYQLNQFEMNIGRADDNQIFIPEKTISSHHARLMKVDQGYVLKDTNSTNGTFINEQRLIGAQTLKNGDVLRFGTVVICEIQVY